MDVEDTQPELTKLYSGKMILSNPEVVKHTCTHLEDSGWDIHSTDTASSKGDDIIANKKSVILHVEALGEGETIARPGAEPFGQRFDKRQVEERIAAALYRALCISTGGGQMAALALADTSMHRMRINDLPERLGVVYFWISREDGKVRADYGHVSHWFGVERIIAEGGSP